MSDNGLGKKVLVVGVVIGVLAIVVRRLRSGAAEDEEEDGIDRIDTGNERNEEPVDTGLDRVDTAGDDEDDATVPVAAEDRFAHLDLFDYVAILAAAVKAAKSEYESRS
jgi:hypothetical protein